MSTWPVGDGYGLGVTIRRDFGASKAAATAVYNTRRRVQHPRHQHQLTEHCKGNFLEITRRSLLGLVRVYNFLPSSMVEAKTVKAFQHKLTEHAKSLCMSGFEGWPRTFSPRTVQQG